MHFFILVRMEGYDTAIATEKARFMRHRCIVADPAKENGICGQEYGTGGHSGKTGHLNREHNDLQVALNEFRKYQEMVRGESVLKAVGEAAPLGARYKFARKELIASNMRQPSPRDIVDFHDRLLLLVTEGGAPFDLLAQPSIARLCRSLNSHYTIPNIKTLQKRPKNTTGDDMAFIEAFLTSHVDKVSLTLNDWTSRDKRKFLGVTCHFFSRSSSMVSFIIGMERLRGRQTADNIMGALGKSCYRFGIVLFDVHHADGIIHVCLF